VLAIGGLDPSSGAGLGADLRAVELAGAWGCLACSALTVQSTRGLRSVTPVSTRLLGEQVRELLTDVPVRVVKTGALGSAPNTRWVARWLHPEQSGIPLVVDPVLEPTRWRKTRGGPGSGGLSGPRALAALRELGRAASLLTPNVPEAEALLGARIDGARSAEDAAMALVAQGARAVLLKGGHLGTMAERSGLAAAGGARVVDWLATAEGVRRIEHQRRDGPPIHGTGCTLASLVAGRLAILLAERGAECRTALLDPADLLRAVRWAEACLARLMRSPAQVGTGAPVLGAGAGRRASRVLLSRKREHDLARSAQR
jgi:hydroxymethylpyrimidine/phosphomethylpyrimidine kinase